MLRRALVAALFASAPFACATESLDDARPSPRATDAPLVGRRIEFALAPGALDRSGIEAVAQHLESVLGAESLAIEVKQSDDDGTIVAVTARGREAISDETVVAGLRENFPVLRNAIIDVRPAAGDHDPAQSAQDAGIAEIAEIAGDDQEAIREQVEARLRAQGVKGPIEVEVVDEGDGRQEVRVKVEEHRVQ